MASHLKFALVYKLVESTAPQQECVGSSAGETVGSMEGSYVGAAVGILEELKLGRYGGLLLGTIEVFEVRDLIGCNEGFVERKGNFVGEIESFVRK